MDEQQIRRFWDARAVEDAPYFVDNRQPYGGADLKRFFAEAERDLDLFLGPLGATLEGGQTVIEIGCGIGRLTRVLAARTGRVVALDVSGEMLARARELNPSLENVDWMLGDGVSLEGIGDASADACVSAVVFQHVPEPQITYGYVREVGRVLRPGGWAALNVSDDPGAHRPHGGLAARLRALAGRGPRGQRHPAWLGSAVDLHELRAAAEGAGLSVERVTGEGTQYCCLMLRSSGGALA
jgi:SAM-dependent methyltransferase